MTVRPGWHTLAALLAAMGILTGCTGVPVSDTQRPTSPGSSTADARTDGNAPQPRGLSEWQLGAEPLPVRPDGFGRVLPTPPELRKRRLPTTDLLPPPPDAQFRSSVRRIGPKIRDRMGESWRPGCPVGLDDLRYVRVSFWGFDNEPHTGELIVHRREAHNVTRVFDTLYRARFPIEQMRLVTSTDLPAQPTGDGNTTAGFACRQVRQQSNWSAHSYGLAIDINPFQNPYARDDLVLPELASAYLDRSWQRPGVIQPGGVVTRAFAEINWTWGGSWQVPRDYMHFSATGG